MIKHTNENKTDPQKPNEIKPSSPQMITDYEKELISIIKDQRKFIEHLTHENVTLTQLVNEISTMSKTTGHLQPKYEKIIKQRPGKSI